MNPNTKSDRKPDILYKVGSRNPGSRFLDIEIKVATKGKSSFNVALPTWRPGRYELGNFAKFIRGFKVKDANQKEVAFKKVSSHVWLIASGDVKFVTISYQFYTTELNAGSSWVDKNQLYINPVNCLMYVVSRESEHCTISFDVPDSYNIATGLKREGSTFSAANFDELADSPIICSPNLQHKTYNVSGVIFNIWFQGDLKPNWEKLIKDFKAFTGKQLRAMGDFPFNEYHFLFQILPHKGYHGVEHLNSTVISLGPDKEVMKPKLYDELLGVSSHELYHAWNVKSIRPADMVPYDFSKENYTEMGYLTEGVTTYMGDLFLIKSKVFNLKKYIIEIHKLLDRHSFNYGKYNYSVCESSFDTWLDGYTKGIPNRKTSIYTEGALLALCIDIMLISESGGKQNLDTVMKTLFDDYAKKGIGITEEIFIATIKVQGGLFINDLFDNFYHKAVDYFDLLKSTFNKVGFVLKKEDNSNELAGRFGCYTDKKGKVLLVAPESPAYSKGINVGDQILSVNKAKVIGKEWSENIGENQTLELKKVIGSETVDLGANSSSKQGPYFEKYRLSEITEKNDNQIKNRIKWLGK